MILKILDFIAVAFIVLFAVSHIFVLPVVINTAAAFIAAMVSFWYLVLRYVI
jgi:hypothetical protein